MTAGVLIRPDPKGKSFVMAVLFHVTLIGSFLALNWIAKDSHPFGDPNAGGASVGVEVADKIPIPHSGPQNPVAHDSESEAPQAPPEKVERVKEEVAPPDAVKLNLQDKKKKTQAKQESAKRYLPSFDQLQKNQIYSREKQAVSSPLYSQMPGRGRVGLGENTTLGAGFAAYAAQVQSQIARNWRTDDVTAMMGPMVVASFDLMKDGSVRNITIVRSSGIRSLDFSVTRDLESVSLPPLPPNFGHSSAKCEFTFELKK
jgi:TonB family protein